MKGQQETGREPENAEIWCMSEAEIDAWLKWEEKNGASENLLRRRRRAATSLYQWLPEDKAVDREILQAWRKAMEENGYAPETILSYVKGINRFLGFAERPDLRFSRGRAKNIAGQEFGWLTALEPTEKRKRKDVIWRCQCRCGNITELPSSRLLKGGTLSCGCLKSRHLHSVNKFMEQTSIRQSLEDNVTSERAASGFTGVTLRNGKWSAYINYKRKHYFLGRYSELEDAVKARARAKQTVQEDAWRLLESYEELHRNDIPKPDREEFLREKKKQETDRQRGREGNISGEENRKEKTRARRSDNTSGCTGVSRRRNGWTAKITYQKVTYQLGDYRELDDAVRARKTAEQLLKENPEQFLETYGARTSVEETQ